MFYLVTLPNSLIFFFQVLGPSDSNNLPSRKCAQVQPLGYQEGHQSTFDQLLQATVVHGELGDSTGSSLGRPLEPSPHRRASACKSSQGAVHCKKARSHTTLLAPVACSPFPLQCRDYREKGMLEHGVGQHPIGARFTPETSDVLP